ncbi:patatin-like phospholipase family protein [Sulfitobacter sp. R18_1]|uniref:patatin-like phospholipase family protein n=1 Tax=Sulfitobacter sp. R18_1 TaxID=2821104 RepID=UPI001AD97C67|nr:patatin-like phospholipase family protein [Sulfitobacter sp. R18_1]MBO9429592.1 patatin-like phospholipase family protein [Sulfitobacter sp. R18_1]
MSGDSCRILSLDGGGAKGFYSLGILREVEAILPQPIHETFDLIFGTSTGSIIAALLATGHSVDEIHELYCKHVPPIMRVSGKAAKSSKLRETGATVFGDADFDTVLTGLGIVSTKWQLETPMIFKSRETQAHGRRATFMPGFGCKLADAIEASCSAYPFFEIKTLETSSGDLVELFDGGYCANNPSLYAIADATVALGYAPEKCRLLSLGCGQYPEPERGFIARRINSFLPVQLLQKTLEVNTASMDQLRRLLYSNVPTVRISDSFDKPEMATDMFEHDLKKLNLLRQQGGESFARREEDIRQLLFD